MASTLDSLISQSKINEGPFKHGFEIEVTLLVNSFRAKLQGIMQRGDEKVWLRKATKIAKELEELINDPTFKIQVFTDARDRDEDSYKYWSIVPDESVSHEDSRYDGFEFVSPVSEFGDNRVLNHLRTIWRHLINNYHPETNDTCAFHVHVSSKDPFTLDHLKSASIGILRSENFINAAAGIRENVQNEDVDYYCRSNRLNKRWHAKRIDEAINDVLGAESPQQLVERMCPPQFNAEVEKWDAICGRRYRWNFQNLIAGKGKCTIEFRQMPGVLGSDETIMWINFAILSIARFMKKKTEEVLTDHNPRNLKEFKEGLKDDSRALNIPIIPWIEKLFPEDGDGNCLEGNMGLASITHNQWGEETPPSSRKGKFEKPSKGVN